MERTEINNIYKAPQEYADKKLRVCGWIKTIRDSKNVGFMQINDGSSFKSMQVVFEAEKLSDFKEIAKLNVGSAVELEGTLLLTPQANQAFELNAEKVYVEGHSSPEYPLQKKRHTLEYLRTIAHLRARTNTHMAVFRVRSAASFAIHKFFTDNAFTYIHTPIISSSDAEGAGEMFKVTTLDAKNPPVDAEGKVDYSEDFFGKKTYLTVSGQLQGEAMALAFGKIYTFGPTFRAEKSYTQRHAAEFWMIEPEIAFADLKDDMNLAESMMKYVIKYVLDTCIDELEFLNNFYDKELIARLNTVADSEFAHVTYTDAIELLLEYNDSFEYKVSWGCDLQTEHERCLTEKIFKRPVFVTDYPKEIKAFYMRLNDDGKTVAAMDLLVMGIGEIIGGSQREERSDVLKRRIEESDLKADDYWWYLQLREYGGTKHCGFGLGFERLIMYLTGISNIRDVIPFPRTTGNAEF